jgi:SAM-dependent methyltransferase
MIQGESGAKQRELAYHEHLYSGFAQSHFARAAVRAFRQHSVYRMLHLLDLNSSSFVLSLGCGIGDTELLLAPHVRRIVGMDLSPAGVRQAKADAARLGIANTEFVEGAFQDIRNLPPADAVIAIFFIHHLPEAVLADVPERIKQMLKPGGVFYSLDPSRQRLSGKVGRLLIPGLMKRYETEDERELDPGSTAELFRRVGFEVCGDMYDFVSTPLAGLFPGWRLGYGAARAIDDTILKIPGLRKLGSNFEIIARK